MMAKMLFISQEDELQ